MVFPYLPSESDVETASSVSPDVPSGVKKTTAKTCLPGVSKSTVYSNSSCHFAMLAKEGAPKQQIKMAQNVNFAKKVWHSFIFTFHILVTLPNAAKMS